MNVAELQAHLALLDPMLPVAIAVVQQEGVSFDLVPGEIESVDPCLNDDGKPFGVWLLGRRAPSLPAPELLTLRCSCGAEVVVAVGDWMPDAHDACLRIE
jgi:hypothetical protein